MTDVPTATGSRQASPETPTKSPPPAVVPTRALTAKVKKEPQSLEQRKHEESAFAKFLTVEQQRLRKEFPHYRVRDLEAKLVAKWMRMKPDQRLKYLDGKPRDTNAKENLTDEKASLKRKLDEQFDCRLKLALKPSDVPLVSDFLAKQQTRPPINQFKPAEPQRIIVQKESVSSAPSKQVVKVAAALGLEVPEIKPEIQIELPKPAPFIPFMDSRSGGKVTITKAMPVASSGGQQDSVFLAPQAPVRVVQYNQHAAGAKEALDNYYLALCAPAFPHPDEEPLTPHSASFYFDHYCRLSRL